MTTKPTVGITGDTCRQVVAPEALTRRWRIEWPVPDHFTVSQLRDIVEMVRGYGSCVIRTQDEGIPEMLIAEFKTTPEYNEFDLADSLRDTAVSFDEYHMGQGFPTRPSEVFPS